MSPRLNEIEEILFQLKSSVKDYIDFDIDQIIKSLINPKKIKSISEFLINLDELVD